MFERNEKEAIVGGMRKLIKASRELYRPQHDVNCTSIVGDRWRRIPH